MEVKRGYFDIKRDSEIINAGGFFCYACVIGKPANDISPDPRYCQECYDFLIKEAELDTRRRGDDWKPIIATKKVAQVVGGMRTIMSPINNKKSKGDIIQPSVTPRATNKRGPKFRLLPEDKIKQLNENGMESKAISAWLKRDKGVIVSYKTIQRILSGQR